MTQGPGGRAPPAPPAPPEPEAPTTFCALLPRMPQWKFAAPGGFLGRSPAAARAAGAASGGADPQPEPEGPGARSMHHTVHPGRGWGLKGGFQRHNRVGYMPIGGQRRRWRGLWGRPTLASDTCSLSWQYMGCIEVLRSMRSLDFSTRTQVTREAINRLHEAVPGVRGSWKRKAPNKALASVLGKSNLRFAGMSISIHISTDGLSLSVPTTRQVIATHHMPSISFASGGDTDMTDYVAYVAKDPINQRACHILECCEGLAQSVISTVGQAFELRFKQYLHSPPKVALPPERLAGLEESAWGDEEEAAEHSYYNSIPGKEPPPGGLVDSRLAPTQPCALAALGQGPSHARRDARSLPWDVGHTGTAPPGDGYVQADARGPPEPEEHLYVNTQGLDAPEPEDTAPLQPKDSPKKDLFDMRPFEDALKLHECSAAAGTAAPLPLEDQWPSPPTRRAPVAPTEEQLRQEPWYHGRMSRRAAERLLRADGDFLVRDSVTNPGQYVLTGMHAGRPKHLLLVDPEGAVRTKDVLFESISHLIDHHLQNGQPIVAAESELHLRGVVSREP
ncbi:SHC-transforming protein 2 [Cebus imitator]|uniref:SHC-transforming protein 2 n=1 Tax=Cebus imitator TaxID=2715852 RepID=UPI00189B8F19|nr:SHC-transforming protein 2 [Cebus imitator]